jgi:transglutaminase-like putative cysteine protease
MAAQRNIFVTVARAGLTFAAAIGLARVFAGGSWVVPVFVAAAIPPAALAWAERRRLHVVWAIAGVIVIGTLIAILLDDPSETIAGIPSGAAISNFASDLTNAPHVLRSAVVPVIVGGAALVLAFVAVFAASLVTELIARHLDAPMGAIGPSVALYVAIAALGSGAWAATTACYALVVIAYLLVLQFAELSARRTWFQTGRARRSQMLGGGLVAGVLAVAFAVAIGPLFPGARGGAWINYKKLGVGKQSSVLNAPSPFLSIATKLSRDAQEEIFTVKTSDANGYHWRVIALDDFNGKTGEWGLDAKQASTSQLPGPSDSKSAADVHQTFHMNTSEDPYWLPAAYRPVRISLSGAAVLPDSATLFLPHGSIAGLTYDVRSSIQKPTKAELKAVTPAEIDQMSDETKLPANFSPEIRALAERLTENERTPYDKAKALERFFQSNLFVYDQTVDYSSSPHALEDFVLHKRRGFCEQYAAAFAEMARSVHLPTRIAVGYQMGKRLSDGLYHVKGSDAHAWPEVWMGEAIGWYSFEPTHGIVDPSTGNGSATPGSTLPTNGATTTTVATPGSTAPTTATSTPDASGFLINPTPSSKSGGGSGGTRVLYGLAIAVLALLLAGVATLAVLWEQAIVRTRRRRHAPDSRRRVLGAWNEALDRLSAAGVARRPAATSIEFALRHAPAHGAGGAGPPLMGLARLHTAAMFAPDPPTDADADAAWAHVDAIDRAVRRTVPRGERWLTRLRIRGRDRHNLPPE